ncbi:hypothetical protein [Halopelagius fulvigenes]|uniref:Uncharacterized protein n=1 Tax=Halopelagius fulvigenes TaxID=1198324 RepID=A0ABD5U0Y4_9EURY
MSDTSETSVEIGTGGLDAEIRFADERRYRLGEGRITCGALGESDAAGGNPGVAINGHVEDADAPEIRPGDEVTVRVTYDGESVEFPATGTKSTTAHPAAFKSVRGKQPAGEFEEYETVERILRRAAEDGE